MTAQISDDVYLDNRRYSLCGVKGKGPFDPRSEGIKPKPFSSACWRGFVSTYRVKRGALYLDSIAIGLHPQSWKKASPETELFGVKAVKDDEEGTAVYENLDHKVEFSGGLLIGRGFIWAFYVHMGFHPAYKYEEVVDLKFKDGELVERIDRSAEVEAVRKELGRGEWDGSKALPKWIDDCFRLDY